MRRSINSPLQETSEAQNWARDFEMAAFHLGVSAATVPLSFFLTLCQRKPT